MRRILVVLLLVASGCGMGADERIVRVDFQQDEFASHYWRFFPKTISAHPGDTIVFDQQWTGEPHTVTFGKIVDGAVPRIAALEEKYADIDEDSPPEVLARAEQEYETAVAGLPTFDPYDQAGAANWLQPCYLDRGRPPADPDVACEEREQPEFNGRQAFYSSGFIAPSGPEGNTFTVRLAEDIAPGKYAFYCIVHLPDMQGSLEVKPTSEDLPSSGAVNAAARKEIEQLAGPLREAFADAKAGRAEAYGERLQQPLAGYHSHENFTVALDEFVPKMLTTRRDRPITWTIVGAHTVSFDVPRYLAIYTVGDDGRVRRNPVVDRAAGGSPKAPPVDFTHEPYRIDGGTWDGSGFISSGLLGSEPYAQYTLRISKPGRYRYACLVHPTMVGTVVVRP